jgi:ATP-dependent Lon protease
MLRAAVVLPARFAAAPAVAAAEEFRSPLLRVLGASRGGGVQSMLMGRRAWFCSNSSASDSEASAVEAKAEDAVVAEGEADGKASSAIVPTTPRPEDFLTVCNHLSWTIISIVEGSFAYYGFNTCRGIK